MYAFNHTSGCGANQTGLETRLSDHQQMQALQLHPQMSPQRLERRSPAVERCRSKGKPASGQRLVKASPRSLHLKEHVEHELCASSSVPPA